MILHTLMITAGTLFLISGASYIWPLTKKPSCYYKQWRINFTLICFFIISYIATIIYSVTVDPRFTNHFYAIIFLVGALYVFLTSILSSKTISKIRTLDQIALNYEQLLYHAEHDELTGCYNRRYLMKILDNRHQKIQLNCGKVIILFFDLDGFKAVNDLYGHQVGDETLARLGELLKQQLRKCDIVARYGGDEFVIVIENSDIEQAKAVAEKVIQIVSQISNEKQLNHLHFGCSIGICELSKKYPLAMALKTADSACYQAKKIQGSAIIIEQIKNTQKVEELSSTLS